MDVSERLNKVKNTIDKVKDTNAQLEGQSKVLNKQLKELGFKDTQVAISEMKEMKKEVVVLDEEIESGVAVLEKKLEKSRE